MIFETVCLTASLLLLAGSGIWSAVLVLSVSAVSFSAALAAEKRPWVPRAAIAAVLLPLLLVKLAPGSLPVLRTRPFGLSYYTLQAVAYLGDVASGRRRPERNLPGYLLSLCYFPHLVSGPIYRQEQFRTALRNRAVTGSGFVSGALRASWGIFKKLVIASHVARVVNGIAGNPGTGRGLFVPFAAALYSVELYSDFSGAMDIILGVSRMLGLELPENFDRPFRSETVPEFWRRWHITLGAFFRDHVYIPLGGSRKGELRKAVNVMAVFLLSGLWHGRRYLLWGALSGLLVILGDRLKTRHPPLNRLITFALISALWIFFIYEDVPTAVAMLRSAFADASLSAFVSGLPHFGIGAAETVLVCAASALMFAADARREEITDGVARRSPAAGTALICALLLCAALFGAYGIGFEADAFIYSTF